MGVCVCAQKPSLYLMEDNSRGTLTTINNVQYSFNFVYGLARISEHCLVTMNQLFHMALKPPGQ